MRLDGTVVSLAAFMQAVATPDPVEITRDMRARLIADETAVHDHASRDAPVYGLTTGLGANLGHRLTIEETAAFQAQLIAGRNVAAGPVLPPRTGRATLFARIISASNGGSGLSVAMFDHLCALFAAGFAPPSRNGAASGPVT